MDNSLKENQLARFEPALEILFINFQSSFNNEETNVFY